MIAMSADRAVDQILAERPYLRRVALALTRHHDADADDLVQETILRAFRARRSLYPGSRMRAWLATILRRVYFSAERQRRRRDAKSWTGGRPTTGVEAVPRGAELGTSDAADFASVAEDLDERLRAAVVRVPAVYRDSLCRHALKGLTYIEIARELGVPRGTVMSRIFRARARLRRELTQTDLAPCGGVR